MIISANTPIIEALKELRFSRPAWTQRMLTDFIVIAEKHCNQYEGDGTFSHILDDVFNKEEKSPTGPQSEAIYPCCDKFQKEGKNCPIHTKEE